MDPGRFLDLFVSEAQEHVDLMHRSLLALEGADGLHSIDDAFRAAHTLKGLAAAMGYATVTAIAHDLEDRLHEVRAGRLSRSAEVVDALLADADRLEAAIAIAVETGGDGPSLAAEPPPSGGAGSHGSVSAAKAASPVPADPSVHTAMPPGAALAARVRLLEDAPIKAARATLIIHALQSSHPVSGTHPASFDDDFDGHFTVFFGDGVDAGAAEAVIIGAGDVASVEFSSPARSDAAASASTRSARTPTRHVRVDAGRLDQIAEGIAELSVLYGRIGAETAMPARLTDLVARLGTVLTGLQHEVLAVRMVPVRQAFERLPRVVRDAARAVGRDVELQITGEDVELDRTIMEEIGDPLVHLLRNAVDHGIEPADRRIAAGKRERGLIRVSAERERSSVFIVIADDGGGIDADRVVARAKAAGLIRPDASSAEAGDDLFRLLSHPGFSTAEQVTSVSGRGVGLDVVVSRVRALGGAIEMQTRTGAGTTFSIRLPVTLALALALRVRIGDEDYAIPLTHVSEAVDLPPGNGGGGSGDTVDLRGESVPLVRMRHMLNVRGEGQERAAVIAEMGGRRAALAVDALVGREQILIKSFDSVTGTLPYFSGATLLADGRPALVLDPLSVI